MSSTIQEAARTTTVAASFDVLVAGGGIAGVAAALAARRTGARVALLEKGGALGGLATLGNVSVWLPLCNGQGRQVAGGLGESLLRRVLAAMGRDNLKAGFFGIPRCWEADGDSATRRQLRLQAGFNPAVGLLVLEELLVEAGVAIFYDTRLCAARRQANTLTHAIVENKSGRLALGARVFVDATGDADLCHLAGEPTESLDSNVAAAWFFYLHDGQAVLQQATNSYSPELTRADATAPFYRGDSGREVTAMLLAGRDLIRRRLAFLRARHPKADIQPLALPTLPGFRATRRLRGAFTLEHRHVHQWFADTCAIIGDWRQPGPVWAIPWRSLCAVEVRNLTAAGRCIAAAGSAWDVTRAIPACAITGEAAGTAAALACAPGGVADLRTLDSATLQATLRRHGALLDESSVAP